MASKDTITITLGIFSGRPNPELSLSGDSAEELAKLVKASLGKEKIHPPSPARLGEFYGFRARVAADLVTRLGLPAEFNVHQGVLTVITGRDEKHWRDVSQVERFLTDDAYQQGHGTLLEKVGKLR